MVAAAAGCTARNGGPPPPSVVLISIDTLRADRLNAYGYQTRVVSPELDRLARDGILFERHISASPWTTPSHLSLLTSLSPSAHGVMTTFGEVEGALERGGTFPRLAEAHETLAEALAARGWATGAFTGGVTMDPRIGFDQGFGLYDTSMAKLSEHSFLSLERWVAGHGGRPFFLFWHTFEVHAPYLHPDFLGEVLPLAESNGLSKALARLESTPDEPLPAAPESKLLRERGDFTPEVCGALYDGGVRGVDHWVGRLMGRLKDMGLYDPALIVVTSDHGEQLGESPSAAGGRRRDGRFYNAHGHTVYDELIHVPLIIKLPGGGRAGTRVGAVSRAIDVMPTVLDVLGVPSEPGRLEGRSLRPLWEASEPSPRVAFTEALAFSREQKSLRTARYKYILSSWPRQVSRRGRAFVPDRPAATELYDLLSDPGEEHDLLVAPDTEARRVASDLDAELRQVARDAARRRVEAGAAVLDAETLERVRALGYLSGPGEADERPPGEAETEGGVPPR